MSVKLRRSAGSGKCVFIVGGRSSSVRSGTLAGLQSIQDALGARRTFLYTNLCGTGLWLLLRRRILVLLHAKNLCDRSVIEPVSGNGAYLQHGELFARRWWGEGRNVTARAETVRIMDGDVAHSPSHHVQSIRDVAGHRPRLLSRRARQLRASPTGMQKGMHTELRIQACSPFLLGCRRSGNVRSAPRARLSSIRRGQ